ncbi:hypothetical protein DIS18_08940 [Algibacter marinivivus]|uniref:Uncharacterized protein n=1 Tax=Algibacter marinivivus TaxID=2100723 RepID=A0A2U2X3N4_9FLAO|nr:hypothetical protein DIS18_08940 [Algibacter marinivivus]
MKTKKYLIAFVIVGGLLFTAFAKKTINHDEATTKVERKAKRIFADAKVERKAKRIFACNSRVERKAKRIFA